MSYEPGKMGVAEGTAIVFTTTFTSVFLSIWSVFTEQSTTTAWQVPFITAVCFIPLFMILLFVMERVPGDLYEVCERLLGRAGVIVVTVYLIASFFMDAILLLRQFAENTLLTAIPDLDISFILGWYVVMVAIVIYIGIEPIARAAFIVMPLGLAGLSLLLILIYKKFNLYNLSPWLGQGLGVTLTTGISGTAFFFYAFILPILATSFQDRRTIRTAVLLGTGLVTFFRTMTFIMFTGIFGVPVGKEKVLPFFELTRMIYLNRFVQRLETVYIILWVIFSLATIAIDLYITIYLLTRLFRLASMRPLIFPVCIIAAQLAMVPPDIATTIELYTKTHVLYATPGVFALPIILLLATLIKGRGKAKSCDIN